MTETAQTQDRLTMAEMRVMHAAHRNTDNYQPSEGALATASRLYARGLLEHDRAWPDVTALTEKGADAYWAEIDRLAAAHGDAWLDRHFR